MFGYVNRINSLERDLMNFDIEQTLLWFQAINSDVLSSIEKKDVSINIKSNPNSKNNNKTMKVIEKQMKGQPLT